MLRILVGRIISSCIFFKVALSGFHSTCAFAISLITILLTFQSGACQILNFKSYTIRDGLISDDVLALAEDDSGQLWIGTSCGLNVYDGEEFSNNVAGNRRVSNMINCLMRDKYHPGIMWVGTNGQGLLKYVSGSFLRFIPGNGPENRINALSETQDGTIWCATDRGLFRIVNNTVLPCASKLKEAGYMTINSYKNFTYVPVRGTGVLILNEADSIIGQMRLPLGRNEDISAIYISEPGEIAIGTTKKRLFVSGIDGKIKRYFKIPGIPSFIIKDSDGYVYIGTDIGLIHFDLLTGRKATITVLNGLPGNQLSAGLVDNDGDLWIGAHLKGLCKLMRRNYYSFASRHSFGGCDNSLAIADSIGHIWAVDDRGLFEIWQGDGKIPRFKLHRRENKLFGGTPVSVRLDHLSHLWVSFANGQIRSFSVERLKDGSSALKLLVSLSNGLLLPSTPPIDFMVGNGNDLWISYPGDGIYYVRMRNDGKKPSLNLLSRDPADKFSRALFSDKEERLWVGGYEEGALVHFISTQPALKRRVISTKFINGLPDNSVRAFIADRSGNIWVGTRYAGIAVLKDTSVVNTIRMGDGLISDAIWCFSRIDSETILVGSQLGLQEYRGCLTGGGKWKTLLFGEPVYSCGRAPNGFIYCNTAEKLILFERENEFTKRSLPQVRLKKILVNGESVPISGKLTFFPFSHHTFSFEFSGISLRDEDNLNFEYTLEGYSNEWHSTDGKRSVTYEGIIPGSYVFKVRAISSEGARGSPASFAFTITLPFWRRWWFIVLVLSGCASTVFLVLHTRTKRLLEIERVRARIASDLHDDIGSSLTRIAVLAEVASSRGKKTAHEGKDFDLAPVVERIGKISRELIDSMSDAVWSIDPRIVSLTDLLNRVRGFASEVCDPKGIEVSVNSDSSIANVEMPSEIMRTILLVVKEAINNAVVHSECRKIEVTFINKEKKLIVCINDDGKGFIENSAVRAHGIENMRQRAAKWSGRLEIDSSGGKGTSVRLYLPLEK